MAVGEILIGWALATVSGGLGAYFTWVRGRNDASRDAIVKAYADWMAAWSDLLNLGTSSVVTVGRVTPVETDVLQQALSALSRAMRVCMVTCDQEPVAQTGAMYIIGTQRIAPLLQAGASRDEWQRTAQDADAFEHAFIDTVRKA